MAMCRHASRCFLLLEDNPDMAGGHTAFGADGQASLVRDRDDVVCTALQPVFASELSRRA